MKISARNVFKGKVASVTDGAVNGIVRLDVDGETITATISMQAIADLGLKPGVDAAAIIKATEVMIATEMSGQISARNQITGTIKSIEKGAVNGIVKLEAPNGMIVTSTISISAIDDLGLVPGADATAIIKATSVLIATGID